MMQGRHGTAEFMRLDQILWQWYQTGTQLAQGVAEDSLEVGMMKEECAG
jgi:hypothetical protein